jgi:hypothetical protein
MNLLFVLLASFDAKWLIPIVMIILAVYSASRAVRSIKAGSESGGKIGWFNTGGGWICTVLTVVAIIIFFAMRGER